MKRLIPIAFIAIILVSTITEASNQQSWGNILYHKALYIPSTVYKGIHNSAQLITKGVNSVIRFANPVITPVARHVGKVLNPVVNQTAKLLLPLCQAYINYGTIFFATSLLLWSSPYAYQFLR